MPGLKKKTSKSAFNAGVMTTFGKLDEKDIENVNGGFNQVVVSFLLCIRMQSNSVDPVREVAHEQMAVVDSIATEMNTK